MNVSFDTVQNFILLTFFFFFLIIVTRWQCFLDGKETTLLMDTSITYVCCIKHYDIDTCKLIRQGCYNYFVSRALDKLFNYL